jgi:squalene-hopene/tetraprenyl-beta-curcumene cyclase
MRPRIACADRASAAAVKRVLREEDDVRHPGTANVRENWCADETRMVRSAFARLADDPAIQRGAPVPKTIFVVAFGLLVAVSGANAAPSALSSATRDKADRAVDAGIAFLRKTQARDGSWSKSVGVTALAARAMLESHRKYTEADDRAVASAVQFVLRHVKGDGSITDTAENTSYNTATALVALQATRNPAYRDAVANAQRFLARHQIDEGESRHREDVFYGGIGYSDDDRPDLSNQYMALEALRASGLSDEDPVWSRALVFISRCQNRSESNDQKWAGNDGGFTYNPNFSPHGALTSYGGMTHAGLISLIFASVDKNDPRIQAAYDWIRANYTLDVNPGTDGKSGLYYYYEVFAKAMAAYGEPLIVTTDGVKHNWREDYIRKMTSLQNADGSWVNADSPKWWENDKNLITARVVIGLDQATR